MQFGFNPNLFAPASADGEPAVPAPTPAAVPAERTALPRPAPAMHDGHALASEPAEPELTIRQEEQPDKEAANVVKLDLFRKK